MRFAVIAILAFAGQAPAANLADANKLLNQIKAVSKEGTGNQEAGAAWKELVALGGEAILPTLNAMRRDLVPNDPAMANAPELRELPNWSVPPDSAKNDALQRQFHQHLQHATLSRMNQ